MIIKLFHKINKRILKNKYQFHLNLLIKIIQKKNYFQIKKKF